MIAGILACLNLKTRKFGNYDPSTWLLVYFDDARLPMEGLPILLEKIRNVAAKSPFAASLQNMARQSASELQPAVASR